MDSFHHPAFTVHTMDMKKNFLLAIGMTMIICNTCFSQISSPGLGKAKTATWLAVGIRQDLDTIQKWQSVSYIGIGRKSNPEQWDPLFKPAILVFNQEFYHQFNQHWQSSFALSYRRQDEYIENSPYVHSSPDIQQEFRLYSRLSYTIKNSRLKFVPTFRQEFRKFYTPDFNHMPEDFQFRSRLRLQLSLYLNGNQTRRLIAGSEQLFSISKYAGANSWSGFNYHESRFSLYYSVSPQAIPFTFSLGYVNNLVGVHHPYAVHYLSFDVIFENPFKRHARKKTHRNRDLE